MRVTPLRAKIILFTQVMRTPSEIVRKLNGDATVDWVKRVCKELDFLSILRKHENPHVTTNEPIYILNKPELLQLANIVLGNNKAVDYQINLNNGSTKIN